MPFELQTDPELASSRRRGLAFSVGIHLLLVLFVVINPDFFNTTPTRLIRIAGEEFDRDRFEIQELFLPPELVPVPVPPPVAEAPPAPEIELPPPTAEAAPPPPAPPPPEEVRPEEPPPVITPEDVIAEGARPDAPPNRSADEGAAPVTPPPAEAGGPESGEDGEEGDDGDGETAGSENDEAAPEEPPAELPESTNPNAFALPNLRERAEDIIDQAFQEERRQGAPGRPGAGDGSLLPYDVETEEPTILSDTRGYDFGPYMNQVINRVRFNWYSFIPEAARLGRRGRVVIIFTIVKDGGVENLRIVASSNDGPLDRAASAAIQASNPFPPIPADFDGDDLVLQFAFLYNMRN